MQRSTQKKIDPRKNIFDLRNPRKKYFDPRNPRNPRKNLTHAPTDPPNPRDLADS